jgi:hypothetical protein
MINLLSIKCSLAFAPYLTESAVEYLSEGTLTSRVVRQGGTALIIRSDGEVMLRHQNRQASLAREETAHYLATVRFRSGFYDVSRMQNEVVLANAGSELFLSHPQSELWLSGQAVRALVDVFNSESIAPSEVNRPGFPEWLSVSAAGGQLLISDRRTGRWVLLGEDHMRELERRLEALGVPSTAVSRPAPPTILLKGLKVHLQSALKLAATLEDFANTGAVEPFEEITPIYSLTASGSTEGIDLRDFENRIALTRREAGKWASMVRAELDRLKAKRFERGRIRTVFARTEAGQWILQWGDEIFVPNAELSRLLSSPNTFSIEAAAGRPILKRIDEFLLLLSPETGVCVALTDSESEYLRVADG